MIKLSVGIVYYNTKIEILLDTLKSIKKNIKRDLKTKIIIFNNSQKQLDIIKKIYPEIILINNEINIGFGSAHNEILKIIDSKYHLILNPDVLVSHNCISKLIYQLEANKKIQCIGPKILSNKKSYLSIRNNPTLFNIIKRKLGIKEKIIKNKISDYLYSVKIISGCFMMVKTKTLKNINGFDSRFFLYFEDIDLQMRIQSKGLISYDESVVVKHMHARQSHKNLYYFFIHIKSMIIYLLKWRKIF